MLSASAVLLRHRLLPQPHGFEGLALGGKPLQAHDHSVPKPKHVCLVEFGSYIAAAAHSYDFRLDEDRVAEVNELPWLPANLGEHLVGLAPELLRLFRAAVDLRIGQLRAVVQLE